MKTALVPVLALSAGVASAQPYTIDRSTIDSGGGTLMSANYALSGTIGQPDAGQTLESGAFKLRGGFWVAGDTPTRLCADQNQDGFVTPADFSAWIANFNTMSPIADVNQDNLVTPADFSAWIAAFNQGVNGPTCVP